MPWVEGIKYNTTMHYVYYLLRKDMKIYTGSTSDLKRRISEHEQGKVTSTKPFLPVQLIGYEAFVVGSDARRREKYLKTTEGKRLFRQQYRDVLESSKLEGWLRG